jgi:hypothetical protein
MGEKHKSRSRGNVPLAKLTAVCDAVALNGCRIQLCSVALVRLKEVKDEGWGGEDLANFLQVRTWLSL